MALSRFVDLVDAGWPATECVDRFYGLREFEVIDPEGHVLLFGQDIGPVRKGGHGGQGGAAT